VQTAASSLYKLDQQWGASYFESLREHFESNELDPFQREESPRGFFPRAEIPQEIIPANEKSLGSAE